MTTMLLRAKLTAIILAGLGLLSFVTRVGAAALPSSSTTTTLLNASAALTSGDEYAWEVAVSHVGTLRVYSQGSIDVFGHLDNANGLELASDDDAGGRGNFDLSYSVSPGTYTVRVRGNNTRVTGDFTVVADFEPVVAAGDPKTQSLALKTGNIVAPRVVNTPPVVDVFDFTDPAPPHVRVTSAHAGDTVHVHLTAHDAERNMLAYTIRHITFNRGINPGGEGVRTPTDNLDVDFDYTIPLNTSPGPTWFRAEVADTDSIGGDESTYHLAYYSIDIAGSVVNSPPNAVFDDGPLSLPAGYLGKWRYAASDANGDLQDWQLVTYLDGAQVPTTPAPTAISGPLVTGDLTTSFPSIGTYHLQLTVRDSHLATTTITRDVQITDSSAPSITSSSTAGAILGGSFSYMITATGSPTKFHAIGLPPGIEFLNENSGALTGSATQLGVYNATISAENEFGTGSLTLSIIVLSGAVSAEVVVPSELVRPDSGTGNQDIVLKGFSAAGDLTHYRYSITGPNSVVVTPLTDWIAFSGAPTVGGSATIGFTTSATMATGEYIVDLTVKTIGVPAGFSIPRTFKVVGILSPGIAPGSIVSSTGFTANWNSVTGALSYLLEVATDSAFSHIVFTGDVGVVTSFAVTGLQPNTLYFYRVKAIGTGVTSYPSKVMQLVTTARNAALVVGDNWGTVTPSANPGLPTSVSDGVGALDNQVNVDNRGSATDTIPLRLPPGRGGMEPALSLNYASGGANGPLGTGWSLSTGFPQAITRGRSILARDDKVQGVTFTTEDKFYLDGKRLLVVSGTYGAPDSVYRTEVDSFMTITASGSNGNIETFVAVDKMGRQLTFGKYPLESDGYQKAGGDSETLAYAYALKHLKDTLGNSVHFKYDEIVNTDGLRLGEYVLGEIAYTGNDDRNVAAKAKVTFHYNISALNGGSERLDRSVTHLGNRFFAHSRRLDGINLEFDGERFGYYSLGYEYAPAGGRLRLTSVRPYLRDPSATGTSFVRLPATTFHWTNEPLTTAAIVAQPSFPGPVEQYGMRPYTFGDFDGDGKSDYLEAGTVFKVYRSTGSGFASPATWGTPAEAPYERKVITGDFNGDGKQDILYGDANFFHLFALKANTTGTGFVGLDGGNAATQAVDTTVIFEDPGTSMQLHEGRRREGVALASRITVGDFNGDGLDDLLLHSFDGYVYFVRSTGTGFAVPQKSTERGMGWEGYSEFNWTYAFVGNHYPPENYTLQPIPCDLNGDGKTDYACVVTIRNLSDAPVRYSLMRVIELRLSLGDGNFSRPVNLPFAQQAYSSGGPVDWLKVICGVMPVDVNNDGLTDFMVLGDNPADAGLPKIQHRRWTLFLNRGTPTGSDEPVFEQMIGAIPNTITNAGESFNTFYMAFTGVGDNGILNPTMFSNDTNANRRRAAVESSGGSGMHFTDMNGDGYPDLVWYACTKHIYPENSEAPMGGISTDNKGWWVMYSTGGVPNANGAYFINPTRLTNPSRNSTTPSIWETAELIPTAGSESHFSEVMLSNSVDVNGDGRPDWTCHSSDNGEPTALLGLTLGAPGFGDVVDKVSDGLGRTTEIAYLAAKNDLIYTKGADVSYPIREFRSSQPVVSDVWQDSGSDVPAQRAHFTYQYSGNRMDLSGRGSLGFHSFITLDTQTKVFKYQFLVQSFPMTGLTHREETYRQVSADSFSILSSHDNTVVFDKVMNGTSAYGTLYPFISRAVESRWEDGAQLVSTDGLGTSARPESLYAAKKPDGAHITIVAESLFDGQTTVRTDFPAGTLGNKPIDGYEPSDTIPATTTEPNKNVVAGTRDLATFNNLFGDLRGEITYGNVRELATNYGDGYGERVVTGYDEPTNGMTGRVHDTQTFAWGGGHGTAVSPEKGPKKTYTYKPNTPLVVTEHVDASLATNANSDLTTTTTYERDELGRVTNTSIAGTKLLNLQPGDVTWQSYAATAFDPNFDRPKAETDAYGHPTTTEYNPLLGKPKSVTGANADTTEYAYDALGRTTQVSDLLRNLTTTTAFAWDASVSVGGPADFNGVAAGAPVTGVVGLTLTSSYKVTTATTVKPTVTSYYDRLGRLIRTIKDGFGGQQIVTDNAYNNLGQLIATSLPYVPADPTRNTVYWTKTTYDALGRVKTVTAPNGTVTTTTYVGRATTVSVDAPALDGGVDPAAQATTTLVDPKGRTVKVWNADNAPGTIDRITGGANPPSIAFTLDGFGRMVTTTLKGQTQTITASYDALGRQLSLNDPDKGDWLYVNSALGHVLEQQDAADAQSRRNVTATTYDRLGRPLTRTTTEREGAVETASWFYYETTADASTHPVAFTEKGWVGALQREESATNGALGYAAANSATTTAHYYDIKGRPMVDVAKVDGRYFYTTTEYDDYSRVQSVRHSWRPPGHEDPDDSAYIWQNFGYTYEYDGTGASSKSYLIKLTDSLKRSWWDTPTYDHFDRVTSVCKGGSYWTKRGYRPTDGVLSTIRTGPSLGDATIQNLSFTADGLGNVRSRGGSGGSETFDYDDLNRLTSNKEGAIGYQPNGNILTKVGVGGVTTANYTYDPNDKPHAVRSAFGYAMTYDPNGNLLTREKGTAETWNLKWTGFDKPRWMAKTTTTPTVKTAGSEFLYNANRSRTVQLEFDAMSGTAPNQVPSHYVRKRVYGLGPILEANYDFVAGADPWKLNKIRIYVPGPDGMIGAREFDPTKVVGEQETPLVYHYDHLGSIESITPYVPTEAVYAAGADGKPARYNEDAWGQRRNPFTWSGAPVTLATDPNKSDDGGADSVTPRGFTGHEMLDDLGLVHMNGRIYDPLLGRFLSADILVQSPGDLQSYNRYSYVQNNPLRYTDPSGFQKQETEEEKKAREAWENQLKAESAARQKGLEGTTGADIVLRNFEGSVASNQASASAEKALPAATPVKDQVEQGETRARDGSTISETNPSKEIKTKGNTDLEATAELNSPTARSSAPYVNKYLDERLGSFGDIRNRGSVRDHNIVYLKAHPRSYLLRQDNTTEESIRGWSHEYLPQFQVLSPSLEVGLLTFDSVPEARRFLGDFPDSRNYYIVHGVSVGSGVPSPFVVSDDIKIKANVIRAMPGYLGYGACWADGSPKSVRKAVFDAMDRLSYDERHKK